MARLIKPPALLPPHGPTPSVFLAGSIEMGSAEAADKAISALNGKDVGGRQLTVNLAKERSR